MHSHRLYTRTYTLSVYIFDPFATQVPRSSLVCKLSALPSHYYTQAFYTLTMTSISQRRQFDFRRELGIYHLNNNKL